MNVQYDYQEWRESIIFPRNINRLNDCINYHKVIAHSLKSEQYLDYNGNLVIDNNRIKEFTTAYKDILNIDHDWLIHSAYDY